MIIGDPLRDKDGIKIQIFLVEFQAVNDIASMYLLLHYCSKWHLKWNANGNEAG